MDDFLDYIEPVFSTICDSAWELFNPGCKGLSKEAIIAKEINLQNYLFPVMFMMSDDKGKSFSWYMTRNQKEYVVDKLKEEQYPDPSELFDEWIQYKFSTSGLVSYLRETKRKTEYITNFNAGTEPILIAYSYELDFYSESNYGLFARVTYKGLNKIDGKYRNYRDFEGIWGFEDTPFFYFEILPLQPQSDIVILGLIPCHELRQSHTIDEHIDSMGKVKEIIDFSQKHLSACYELKNSIEKSKKEIRGHALKSAISAIMSRNGSHNIGSHVINRVVENIDTLNIQDHKYFLRYLQQRMDFVAQISTEFPKWSTSHWFVMEIMKNFYSQKHLLNYIVESEGLKAYEEGLRRDINTDKLQCVIKNIKKYNLKSINDEHSYRESYCELSSNEMIDCKYKEKGQVLVCDRDVCKADPNGDIKVAVPGGMVGFHALYTIIENFLRNSAKHNYARYPDAEKENRKEPMLITFKIWNYEDVHDYYTVRIRDNYSYISGLIAERNFEEELAEGLDKKKILILHPEKEAIDNINLCLEENDNIKFGLANRENITDDTNDIIFIIDDGKVFRENGIKPSYCDLMLDSRVRFIEEAYWNDFLRKTKPFPISVDDQIRFLKQYFIPAHLKINNKIINPLIEDDGSLRKADWGIAEMKISAGFLYKKDISQIGGGGEENLDNLIKAIAIPEYREGKIRAYRLGYEFRMLKPVDVLLIGYSGDDIEELKREAILPVDTYDKTKHSAEMAIILDNKNKPDDLLALLKSTKCDINKIKTLIEDYPGRLFVVSDDGNLNKKISCNKFIKKRIINISLANYKKIITPNKTIVNEKEQNYLEFKNCLLKYWIEHVEEIKGEERLDIVVKPKSESSVGTSDINPKEMLGAASFIYELWDYEKIDDTEYEEILDKILSGEVKNESEVKDILKKLSDDEKNNIETKETRHISPIVEKMFDMYGIYKSGSYQPSTLPKILRADALKEGKDICESLGSKKDYFDSIGINFHNDINDISGNNPAIIYQHHREVQGEYEYQENLSGGAMHYHLFAYPKDWIEEFAANIIENGLLKIAIMDERIAGSNILKTYHPDLEAAGIYFINKFYDFPLDYEWSDGEFLEIAESSLIENIDILIIHQGLLDKMGIDKETITKHFRQLKDQIPYIFVTSGRGRPDTIPEGVKFVPFGIIESALLQKPHSKLLLVKQLLGGISD